MKHMTKESQKQKEREKKHSQKHVGKPFGGLQGGGWLLWKSMKIEHKRCINHKTRKRSLQKQDGATTVVSPDATPAPTKGAWNWNFPPDQTIRMDQTCFAWRLQQAKCMGHAWHDAKRA